MRVYLSEISASVGITFRLTHHGRYGKASRNGPSSSQIPRIPRTNTPRTIPRMKAETTKACSKTAYSAITPTMIRFLLNLDSIYLPLDAPPLSSGSPFGDLSHANTNASASRELIGKSRFELTQKRVGGGSAPIRLRPKAHGQPLAHPSDAAPRHIMASIKGDFTTISIESPILSMMKWRVRGRWDVSVIGEPHRSPP